MSITEIVDNLYMTEDKELFFKAYRLWCNILYGKYGISEELLEAFIKDIYEANKVYAHEDIVISESKRFISDVVINSCGKTTTGCDSKLKDFINENS